MTQTHSISSGRAWLLASRPRTLPAAVSPVLLGIAFAVADQTFAFLPALAALTCALLLQIAANLANDYFDYVKGTDSHRRKGPIRVAQSGLIPLSRLRAGIAATLMLAAIVGSYLVSVAGWPILLVGIASILSALIYTGGPFPIGYHGLGDLFVFLFFGVAGVCGAYYVQALAITPPVLVASLPVGSLTVAILVVNNLRDLDSDRRAEKRTLAVLLGPHNTRREYAALIATAYAVPFVFWILGWFSAWVMLPWLTLPLAIRLVRTVFRTDEGPTLNSALAGTANLDLLFSLLLALGVVASRSP